MIGRWHVIGVASDTTSHAIAPNSGDVTAIEFLKSRNVVVTLRDGSEVRQLHRWHYMNSMTHLDWNDRAEDPATHAQVAIVLRDRKMYIPWPPAKPDGKYLVLER